MPKNPTKDQTQDQTSNKELAELRTAGEPAPSAESSAIAELKELTRTLLTAVQAMHAETARNEVLRSTIDDVKNDVKAAARAMLLAPTPPAREAIFSTGTASEGKCGPCECVSDACCCFDIILSKVRATKPQIEPPDVGDIPIPPTINALEIQFYITVGNTRGFLFPGIGSTFDLRAEGLPAGPGAWCTFERPIDRICLKKGTKLTTTVEVEVREHDEGVERPIAFKDEYGQAVGTITLDCCADIIYPAMPLDVPLLYGGEGGGIVTFAYYARRVCC